MSSKGQGGAADAACASRGEMLRQAWHRMRDLGMEALAVRGAGGRLAGFITRDMVLRRIAAGGDPAAVTVAEVAPQAPDPADITPTAAQTRTPGNGSGKSPRPTGSCQTQPGVLPMTAAGSPGSRG